MAMDDLFKSLAMFQDGMQQLAVTAGVKNAADQVQQVNMSMNDELEKRKAQGQIAQQLGMQLSAIGAPVSQIQQAVGTIAPPQIKNANDAYNQALQTSDPGMMKMAKDMSAFENKPAMDIQNDAQSHDAWQNQLNRDMELSKASMKKETRLQDHEMKQVDKISTQFQGATRGLFEGRDKAAMALQMLDGDNPVADKAVLNVLVKGTGDTGAITEGDRAAFAGSPQIWARMKRSLEANIASGKLNDDDRKNLKGLAELMKRKNEASISEHRERYAKLAGSRLGMDPEALKEKIFPGFDAPTAQAPAEPKVKMIAPNGKVILVPQSQVDAVIKKGAKRAP